MPCKLLKIRTLLLSFFLLLSFSLQADSTADPLSPTIDPYLQANLEQRLKELSLSNAAQQKKLAITLIDITDASHPRVASINGNNMMYAASLPKIAILLGAFERIEQGDMVLDDELREQLTKMIRYSSNTAATEVLNRVGKEYLAELLQSPRFRLYDKKKHGGLWVGKEYGKGGAWKRDPLHNLSHGATSFQAARFYYLLETGQLVSPALTKEMKEILSKPGIAHKFVKGLKATSPNAEIYRKSGSWRHWHADSALVEHDGHSYIAVALAEDPKGGQWLSDIIVALDDLVLQPAPLAYLH